MLSTKVHIELKEASGRDVERKRRKKRQNERTFFATKSGLGTGRGPGETCVCTLRGGDVKLMAHSTFNGGMITTWQFN